MPGDTGFRSWRGIVPHAEEFGELPFPHLFFLPLCFIQVNLPSSAMTLAQSSSGVYSNKTFILLHFCASALQVFVAVGTGTEETKLKPPTMLSNILFIFKFLHLSPYVPYGFVFCFLLKFKIKLGILLCICQISLFSYN